MIDVQRSGDKSDSFYQFNLTATGLGEYDRLIRSFPLIIFFLIESNQSFEILWSKRVHSIHSKSVNYWFYPEYKHNILLELFSIFIRRCVTHGIHIRQNNNHTIVFTVSDSIVSRVEFIIRRCHSVSRKINGKKKKKRERDLI